MPPEVLAQRKDLLKDRLALEMKKYFKRDFQKIGRMAKVARYAEEIAREEKADPAVAIIAAYLLDLAPPSPEGSPGEAPAEAGQDKDGSAARDILGTVGATPELIEEVLGILNPRKPPGQEENVNVRVVSDADRLARLEEGQKEAGGKAGERRPEEAEGLLTETGRRLARKLLTPGA